MIIIDYLSGVTGLPARSVIVIAITALFCFIGRVFLRQDIIWTAFMLYYGGLIQRELIHYGMD